MSKDNRYSIAPVLFLGIMQSLKKAWSMFRVIFLFFGLLFFGFIQPPEPFEDLSEISMLSFEEMMGKETSSWKYLQKKCDFELCQFYKDIFEKKRHLHLQPSENYKIPKIIHFIWLGPKAFPPQSVSNIRSWIEKHPDWVVKFWTDKVRPPPCKEMQLCLIENFQFKKLKECYESSDNWGEKSDLLRFEILLQEGGVYTDHDSNCLHPFDDFHKAYDFYGCLEQPHIAIEGFTITAGNGLLAAKKNHPIIQESLNQVVDRWDFVQKMYPLNEKIHKMKRVQAGAYMALNLALHKKLENSSLDDIVFPASYFFASEKIPSIYSQHFYQASWAKPYLETNFQKITLKKVSTIKKKFHALFVLGSSFFASFLCFSLFLKRKIK